MLRICIFTKPLLSIGKTKSIIMVNNVHLFKSHLNQHSRLISHNEGLSAFSLQIMISYLCLPKQENK